MVIERGLERASFDGTKLTAVIGFHKPVFNAKYGTVFHAHIAFFERNTELVLTLARTRPFS